MTETQRGLKRGPGAACFLLDDEFLSVRKPELLEVRRVPRILGSGELLQVGCQQPADPFPIRLGKARIKARPREAVRRRLLDESHRSLNLRRGGGNREQALIDISGQRLTRVRRRRG